MNLLTNSFRTLVQTLIVCGILVAISWCRVGHGQVVGQFDSKGVWKLQFEFSEAERSAMEPAAPQFSPLGGPLPGSSAQRPPAQQATGANRDSVANMFGTRFPWVQAVLKLESPEEYRSLKCRIRYDGDFTYMMTAANVKRPLYVEIIDNQNIQGCTAFRLHTMHFDAEMLRERVATHVFASLKVPTPRIIYSEVHFIVEGKAPQRIGLYNAIEAVNENLLERHAAAKTSLLLQTNGLNSIQFAGENWVAYAQQFRSNREPTQKEQERVIAFLRLISSASDSEFDSQIDSFVDVESLLRYVAAQSLASNVTGFSSIGANDYLSLDVETGKFLLVANELETALGLAALSGSHEQLADLSLLHPYASECKLIDRVLKKHGDAYRQIVNDAVESTFAMPKMEAVVAAIEASSVEARAREKKSTEERARQANAGFGGFGGGFGPAQSPPAPMDIRTFIKKRGDSIAQQLANAKQGYVPAPMNFGGGGGGGFGPPRRQGAQQSITASQFIEEVRVPDGFKATLFAKSPEVNYPVAISAEPTGAIYVASDEQGSLGTDKNGGKILRCLDRDGDGQMDSVTTFCRVDHVRGVVYRSGAVWVSHPPFLSVFHDNDADGVADRQRQLVSGLTTDLVNTRGGDHTTNGIRMGVDGWLYIGDGDYGVPNAKGIDGSTVVLRGGGILRVRPDGTELELFSSGLRNPFDIAIDPQLNMFTRDNTNDGGGWDTRVSQLFQSAEYGYPRLFANFSDEIMPTLGTFGSGGGTGSLYIEDDAWPDRFNRSLFTGDWGRSAVFHHPTKQTGPTYELAQETFATLPRATGMDLDAAGNLFVASWWSGEASVYVGPQVGFVARVTPTDVAPRDFPELNSLSATELVELLRTPRAVARFHVQGELIRRGEDPETIRELTTAVTDAQFPLNGRIAALFALKQIEREKSHPLIIALTADPNLREVAIRALTDRKSQLRGLTAELITPFLKDESPRVRAQALIALGRLGDSSVAGLIIPFTNIADTQLPDPAKPNPTQVLPHLAMRSLIELNAVDGCLQALDGEHWRGALRVLRYMHSKRAIDGLIARLLVERDTDRRSEILVTLIRLYQQEKPYDGSWWGIRPDTTGPFYDGTTWEESKRIQSVIVTALRESDTEVRTRLRAELKRHQISLPGETSATMPIVQEQKPIVIQPVDPTKPNQIGHMKYEDVLAKAAGMSGNAEAGAALFKARACNACHTSAAGQQPIGPHLVDIGKRYKANELIESIVKPSEKIAQGYETQVVLLESGAILTGFVIAETGRSISLRDSQGKTHTIERDKIEQRSRQEISAMPEGLVSSLEVEKLADLIAYLQSL